MKKEFSAVTNIIYLMLFMVFASSPIWAQKTVKNLEGTLEIRMATYLNEKQSRALTGKEVTEYALRVNDKLVYSLKFIDNAPANLKTGQRIKLLAGKHLSVNAEGTAEIMLTAKDVVIEKDVTATAMPDAFGEQKTIVMLVNFQDDPTERPWTIAQVNDVVFNTLNGMFREFSYNQASMAGNVIGWYTIAMNHDDSCDNVRNALPGLANQAAQNAGVDISGYTRRIYMFPSTPNCGWAGLGSLGGKPSIAWLNGLNRADVTGHEVGHNLGLWHSHSLECVGSPNQGSCSAVEYGDYADTMGAPYVYAGPHFNAFQKERLGWLNYQNSPPIKEVTQSGSYTIDPLETANGKVKALKILKNTLSNGDKEYYYLEFRQGIGYDKKMGDCTDCDFTQGVIVHEANSANGNSSYILDMSPNDSNKSKRMTLHQGQSFTDEGADNGGVTFAVDSVAASGATVNVKFGKTPAPDCRHFNPTLSVVPYDTVYVKQGETAFYDFTLWNNDSATCPASTYNLSVYTDHSIGVSLPANSIILSPGDRREFRVSAATSLETPVGTYGVGINAQNLQSPGHHTYVIASLGVQ